MRWAGVAGLVCGVLLSASAGGEESSSKSRWGAMVPFGAGQFQNGDVGLGAAFAGTEVAAALASIVTGANAQEYAEVNCWTAVDPDTGYPVDCGELEDRFEAARTANWITFGTLCTLAVVGIIQAQIAFDDGTTVEPTVEAGPDGATVGTVVRF